jgi:DNA-binding NarL/FixJ family response regulator
MRGLVFTEDGTADVPAQILIVEDHAMLAEALALGLAARGHSCRVAELDGPESVLLQAAQQSPSLVLLDLDLGGIDGLDLLPALRTRGTQVLVVTGYTDERRLAASLALGAVGWVSKTEPFERLLEAAELALSGGSAITAREHVELVDLGWVALGAEREAKRRMATLTAREHDVLAALAEGKSADTIAEEFAISLTTVRTHVRAVLAKLGVSSQLAAVAKVRELAVYR